MCVVVNLLSYISLLRHLVLNDASLLLQLLLLRDQISLVFITLTPLLLKLLCLTLDFL